MSLEDILKDGKMWFSAIKRFLRKEVVWFPVWGTIRIGTPDLRTADGCRTVLKAAGCKITYWTNDILGRLKFAANETELDLVVVSVAELGFEKGATRVDIYTRAQEEFGLDLCPADVGPALPSEYNQPYDELLLVATEPIIGSDGNVYILLLEHRNDGLCLSSGIYGLPDSFWLPGYRVVFVRRKSS